LPERRAKQSNPALFAGCAPAAAPRLDDALRVDRVGYCDNMCRFIANKEKKRMNGQGKGEG
jgi:hypothetical protein